MNKQSGWSNSLKYFIWEWQVHFNISAQVRSEIIFDSLDINFSPETFIIGYLIGELDGEPICIEPERLEYILPDFNNIFSEASEIYTNRLNILYTGPGQQEKMDLIAQNNSLRRATENKFNKIFKDTDRIYFVSDGILINNYMTYGILSLKKEIYNANIHLYKRSTKYDIKVYNSFIECVKNVFLSSFSDNFKKYRHMEGSWDNDDYTTITAAKRFSYTLAWAGKEIFGSNIYESCEVLSTMFYEKKFNHGHLIIAEKNHQDIEMLLEIDEPFIITNYRKTLKMLVMSNENVGVITDSYNIYGLGKKKTTYNPLSESIFDIFFTSTHCWDAFHCDDILLRMQYGKPVLNLDILHKENFCETAKRIFKQINNTQVDYLYNLTLACMKQAKGAMLIFAEDALNEAKRLSCQCITLKPQKISPNILTDLLSIDGGLLIDLDGIIHAQSVVLDGVVGYEGDPSRGSRYNSALRYEEHRNKNTMIIVISDDGMVDIVPNLRPQIRHSDIVNNIKILEDINTINNFDSKTFNDLMSWFKKRNFYLTKEECEKINYLKESLSELDRITGERTMWVIHEDLHPNRKMNDSYYISEKAL